MREKIQNIILVTIIGLLTFGIGAWWILKEYAVLDEWQESFQKTRLGRLLSRQEGEG